MSYYNVAHHFDWWLDDASSGRKFAGSAAAAAAAPTPTDGVALLPVSRRTFLEDFSRDSFENVLFSIARFKEVCQKGFIPLPCQSQGARTVVCVCQIRTVGILQIVVVFVFFSEAVTVVSLVCRLPGTTQKQSRLLVSASSMLGLKTSIE